MFDKEKGSFGIAPIAWCNDDMPELGAENTFRQTVSEMALAGFAGTEIGNKYPNDPSELKWELDLRGMRVASRWFSSFILTKPMEQVEADFLRELDFLSAVGANRINVSEQSYSIQGQADTPVLAGRKHVMNQEEWICSTRPEPPGRPGPQAGVQAVLPPPHGHRGADRPGNRPDAGGHRPGQGVPVLRYGHFTFAGEDPLAMLKKYAGRVGHVHLKDMRRAVVDRVAPEGMSFLQAVRQGAFTVPGDGCVDFDPHIRPAQRSGL